MATSKIIFPDGIAASESQVGLGSTSTNNFYINANGQNGKLDFYIGNGSQVAQIDSSGNIKAGGNVTASASLTASDARLKKNIETINNALEIVLALRGVRYDKNGLKQIGLIAQETAGILPEVVDVPNNPDEFMSIAYGNIVGLLVEAIKNQQNQIDDLKRTIQEKSS